ncbi:uncharacterized protein LOC129909236 isoform X2 [Episyrphus balteatus]|uniref:uncharacterized protein LOC129909236 isoform X2 n=1 Tax=Episyrphus balteatus TaxID=286459 RepID=UPI0024852A6E|nr:uncharacterized protein LOC129909236 isoform X2 [Episyrphus balteatus]
MYCFGRKYSYEVVQLEDFTSTQCLSTKTIAEWYGYFREMVIDHFLYNDEEVDKVGGPGRIVQIDISKFGCRSYTRSKINRVVDNWVLGIIEEGSEDFKLKVCTETIQNADTDYSEIYDCLSEHGFVHKKVKHCDPNNQSDVEDGRRSHTPRIQSQWAAVKGAFYKDNNNRKDSNSQSFADWIVEYQWRRNLRKKFEDPFEQLVKAVLNAFGDFRNT